MISYKPFYKTLKKKDMSQYILKRMGVSSCVLESIKAGNSITLYSVNKLCLLLDCEPSDIYEIIKTDEEVDMLKKFFVLPYREDIHKNRLKSQIRFDKVGKKTETT